MFYAFCETDYDVCTAEISTKFNEPQSDETYVKSTDADKSEKPAQEWSPPEGFPEAKDIAVRRRGVRKGEYDWARECMFHFADDYDGRKRECFERIVNAPMGKNTKAAKKDKVESKTKTGKSTNTVRGIRWIATQINVQQTPPMLSRAAVLDAYGFYEPAAYYRCVQTEMTAAAARRTHSTTSTPPEKKRKTPHFARTDSVSSSSSEDDPTTATLGKRDYERATTEMPRKKRRRRKKEEYAYLPISRCL